MQNNLSAGMIVAGWDAVDGGSVYALPLGGAMVKVPFSIGTRRIKRADGTCPHLKLPLAGGSGSAYIYGYCDKHWSPSFSEEECRAFVVS